MSSSTTSNLGTLSATFTVPSSTIGNKTVCLDDGTNTPNATFTFFSLNITFALNGINNDASDTILTIDGTNYTYSQITAGLSFTNWAPESEHTITAASTVSVSGGTKQYVFLNWTNPNGLSGAGPSTFSTPSSNTTVTVNFQTQYKITPYYTLANEAAYAGSPNMTDAVQYISAGEARTATPTIGSTGGTDIWADQDTSINYTSPVNSGATERWKIASEDTTTHQAIASVTSSQNITQEYYHQYQVAFSYSTSDSSTITIGAQIGNLTSFGSSNGNLNAGAT